MNNTKQIALTLPGSTEPIQTPGNIPSGAGAPGSILSFGIGLLFVVVIVAALIFALYGGILWITSQGDKAKLDRARRTITFAIVGIIVAVLSFLIVQTIGDILGVPFLKQIGNL